MPIPVRYRFFNLGLDCSGAVFFTRQLVIEFFTLTLINYHQPAIIQIEFIFQSHHSYLDLPPKIVPRLSFQIRRANAKPSFLFLSPKPPHEMQSFFSKPDKKCRAALEKSVSTRSPSCWALFLHHFENSALLPCLIARVLHMTYHSLINNFPPQMLFDSILTTAIDHNVSTI